MATDGSGGGRIVSRAVGVTADPEAVFDAVRRPGAAQLLFDGRGGYDGAWPTRVALRPRVVASAEGAVEVGVALDALDGAIARRRRRGGPGATGIALTLAYEALAGDAARREGGWNLLAVAVDAAIACGEDGGATAVGREDLVDTAVRTLASRRISAPKEAPPVRVAGAPRTSLPREAYLRAVARVKRHIELGDIYQANLTQRLEARFAGDPWDLYRALVRATPAPRSAFLEAGGVALASVSPEVFVDVDARGRAQTRPIKGTRERGLTPAADAAAASELMASAKDRAELVMIVDLERNDLGRIAKIGGVSVPELLALRSYPAVHHLVARVEAELEEVRPSALIRAVFPGGSITGAPKESAVAILAALEPRPRGLYTGSLIWLDDDGSIRSSILIRSAIVRDGWVSIGAGGGVVADSEPEAEWMESNAKARSLTRVLGFDPEEASC